MSAKSEMRACLRRTRQSLTAAKRRDATRRINRRLNKIIRRGSRIAVYRAVGSEADVTLFARVALQRGAQVFEPHTVKHSRRLWFTPWQHGCHRKIRKIRIEHMQYALLPLIGIDKDGFRLGQGGGYYDTSLTFCRRHKPRLIGVGFACQLVAVVPREAHDRRADAFVCEQKWLDFPS